jgi:hypothetical protein
MFRLARDERDAWVTWPARVAALMASELTAALGMHARWRRRRCRRFWRPMSVPSSTASPRSGQGSDEEAFAFDGAKGLLRAWRSGIRPDPDLTRLELGRPPPETRLAGLRRAGAVPHRAHALHARDHGPALARGSDPAGRVHEGSAGGRDRRGQLLHWVRDAPRAGPMLAVQPTVELAKRNSRQRIDPLIEESPELRERVKPARSRDAGNTMLSKEFAGGILIMTGLDADDPRREPDRDGLCGERPAAVPGAVPRVRRRTGAPLAAGPLGQGAGRHAPAGDGAVRLHRLQCRLDRRGAVGRREQGPLGRDPALRGHRRVPSERDLFALGAAGGHGSGFPVGKGGRRRGDEDLREHLARRDLDGDRRGARLAAAGRPARAWTPGTVPERGLFLTAGADVQKDRIEVDVWAWGRGLESWLVDHLVLEGGPGDPACWQQLTDLLGRTWTHASGQPIALARLAIDSGFETSAVYAWSRQVGFAQVAPVKGVEGFTRTSPVTGPTYVDATVAGKRLRRGARLWTVATSTFKAETYRFLRQDRPTRGRKSAERRRASVPARHDPSAGLGGRRMAEAADRRAAGDGAHETRLRAARMAEAARTQRGAGHAGSMPVRRRGSRARIAGPRRGGPIWRPSSGWRSRTGLRPVRQARHPSRHDQCRAGAGCARATWGEGQGASVR